MNTDAIKALYKKHPVGVIASAVAIVVIGLFLYRHAAVAEMQTQVDQKMSEGQRLATNITYSSSLENQLQAMEAANSIVGTRLINPNDLANNLQYFYKLETETGVKLLNTPRPAAEAAKAAGVRGVYVPVQYAVSVQGSYKQILNFLRKLEQGMFYCRVKNAVCSQAQQASESASAEVILSLTVELLGRS